MSGTSEEKKLPPTPKKLRDARKKGQSARSADLVSGVSACAGLSCLWWRAGAIEDKWHETVRLIDKLQEQPFTSAVPQALSGLLDWNFRSQRSGLYSRRPWQLPFWLMFWPMAAS
ncbi:type III secretory pathway component EscU [Bradyrhizobium elkanii]|nr:type III secretory pathway component EscU [Bradyrhizobium elkanii]